MIFLPLATEASYMGISSKTWLLILAVLAAAVLILSKILNSRKKSTAENSEADTQAAPAEVSSTDSYANNVVDAVTEADEDEIPHIPGFVVLDGVSEQDAAVLMAITAHKTGIDLERLDFKSIKRLNQDPVLENVEEQDAAVLMAIVSNKTGIPLENLIFNSIKLVED